MLLPRVTAAQGIGPGKSIVTFPQLHRLSAMTTTRTEPGEVARWFHALSDDTRVRVVDLLASGEMCVCDLQEAVGDVSQSRLSFHLKVLREAGVVNDRKQGRWNFYSLRAGVLDGMTRFLREVTPEGRSWRLSSE